MNCQKKKEKLSLSDTWTTWVTVGFGVTVFAMFSPKWPCPICLAWGVGGKGKKKIFEVYGSYVPEFIRRNGVRTKMNAEIFKHYDVITTLSGSENGGRQFLKASGYKTSEIGLLYKERADAN